jgi:hypothetical protein
MSGSYSNVEPSVPASAGKVWNRFQSAGDALANNYGGFGRFSGQGTAPMSTAQQLGLQGIQNWAMNPSVNESAANNLIGQTLGGRFLNNNPNLGNMTRALQDNMSQAISQQSQDLGSLFKKMGVTYRGPAEMQLRNKALNDFANNMTNLYGSNYQNERANQMNALSAAQAWSQMPATRYSQLMNAGAVPQQIAQNQANFDYTDWLRMLEAQKLPFQIAGQQLSELPLMYPQQQYRPGLLDYFAQLLPSGMKASRGG